MHTILTEVDGEWLGVCAARAAAVAWCACQALKCRSGRPPTNFPGTVWQVPSGIIAQTQASAKSSCSARCVYDDIFLAIRKLRQASGGLVKTCMVVDLDVHQGNGHERDKLHFGDRDTFIVDVYNGGIYPLDEPAKKVGRRPVMCQGRCTSNSCVTLDSLCDA
jgi:hypothetical protein